MLDKFLCLAKQNSGATVTAMKLGNFGWYLTIPTQTNHRVASKRIL